MSKCIHTSGSTYIISFCYKYMYSVNGSYVAAVVRYSELHLYVLVQPPPTINNIFDIDFRSWRGIFDST